MYMVWPTVLDAFGLQDLHALSHRVGIFLSVAQPTVSGDLRTRRYHAGGVGAADAGHRKRLHLA